MITRITNVVVRSVLAAASFVIAAPSHALAIPFSDGFDGISSSALSTPPAGWSVVSGSGTVDSIHTGEYFLTCHNGSSGCVDLDGSTNNAGTLLTSGTFSLEANKTYRLEAWVSGNQLESHYPALSGPDTLSFGFWDPSLPGPISGASSTIASILSSQPFTLVSLLFTPLSDMTVSIFFEAGGGDNVGPILDDVKVSAVPLPAAGWLMLSGLAAFGVFGRRRRVVDAGHPVAVA